MMKKTYRIKLSEIESFCQSFAKDLRGGEIIALIGNLGSGKTTFTKHLGKNLKIKNNISSPTFVIMQRYKIPKQDKINAKWFYHLDIYRLKNFSDLKSLELTEIWGRQETITIIEWADKIFNNLPKNTIKIYLQNDIIK